MKPSLKKGFSMIELIFVIAVLGIIAAVAVPKLMDSRHSAIVTTIKQDISTVTTSIQSYYMMHNKIENISDAVTLNAKTWDIKEKMVRFLSENKECVIIKIEDHKLSVTINSDSSTLCKKLYESGVRDISYELY
ncbi:MAG: prepilin-type cleavage/methylation domain-containing protein [Arcobacter sp.]|nr:MAG: prepilin-type cleavage/methylation domain-containing protein [Arcobacter sp.]